MEKLLKINYVAELLGVSVSSLRNWERDGKLVSVRTPGNHRRYKQSDIEKFLNKKLE